MREITFITGNQAKADYLAKYLGFSVKHINLDLDELQSLDLAEIVEHKARQAYQKTQEPVIVEDVSLEFCALGKLPGPFIKFFLQEMSAEDICALVHGKSKAAVARCVFGYCNGNDLRLFSGEMNGTIADSPSGDHGFGWDRIFIPEGYTGTRASLNEEGDRDTYLKIKPLAQVRDFLLSL